MMTLDVIEADDLARGKHGFFTRRGGVSTGIYASLNCGAGSNDTQQDVTSNRAKVAEYFGADPAQFLSVHQVHSAAAITVSGPFSSEKPRCDGMATATPGVVLGALSADCAPILFEDRAAGVVGAAHAGWRGALAGVAEATVDQMVSLGADRTRIHAAVGPCLSQRNYEVGPEFFDEFLTEDDGFTQYFAGGNGDRMQFDLPRFVVDRVRAAGVANVHWTGHCTYADPDRFFSYRRGCHENLPDYGRLVAAITP